MFFDHGCWLCHQNIWYFVKSSLNSLYSVKGIAENDIPTRWYARVEITTSLLHHCYSHKIHVWYIYLRWSMKINYINVGKYYIDRRGIGKETIPNITWALSMFCGSSHRAGHRLFAPQFFGPNVWTYQYLELPFGMFPVGTENWH